MTLTKDFMKEIEKKDTYYCADCGIELDPTKTEGCNKCPCMEFIIRYSEKDIEQILSKLESKYISKVEHGKELEKMGEDTASYFSVRLKQKEKEVKVLRQMIKDIVHRGRIHSDKLKQQLSESISIKEVEKIIDKRTKEIRKYNKPKTYMGINTIDELNSIKQSLSKKEKI